MAPFAPENMPRPGQFISKKGHRYVNTASHFTRGNPRVEQLSDCHRAASWWAGELNKKRARRQCCLPWCGGRRGLRELAFTKYNKAQIARMPDAQLDAAQRAASQNLPLF